MRNRILKKINPLHSSNCNKYKENNNNKIIKQNDSNNNYKINNDNYNDNNNDIIYNYEDNSSDNEDNYLTIEKEQNDVYNINMEKIRALSNNLNNSNIINRNKKENIFIKDNKELFKSNISSKKNIKKEILINIKDSNNHKKILQQRNKDSFNNNNKKMNKNSDESKTSTSLNEIITIRDDESIDFDPFFLNKKLKDTKEIIKNKKKQNDINIVNVDLILKDYNNENNTKNKYKQSNLKVNKKCIRKKRNIINNLIMIEEEEKTIIYNNNKSNYENIKIMNYFQKIINKNNKDNNNNKNCQEIIYKNNNNKNVNNNLNKKNIIMNSDKKKLEQPSQSQPKIPKIQQIDIFNSKNELLKNNEQIKIKGNNINIVEKKNIKISPKKQNIISNKYISNDKLTKTNLISKKNLNMKIINDRYCNEEEINKKCLNKSINNINKEEIIKNEDNSINLMNDYKMKKTEINNSLDYSTKKNEIKQKNLSNSLKKNIYINNGNNNKSEKRINTNLNNIKKITRLKSVEKTIKSEISKNNSIQNNNNFINYKFTTKKNKTYFISNKTQKIINNSSNDIHKLKEKNEIIEINHTKKINNKNKINKSNKNPNIQISNYIVPKTSKNLYYENNGNINNNLIISSFRTNQNVIQRSVSPNLNNFSFYSKIELSNAVMNEIRKHNNKKYEFNNVVHKEFFKNEDKKNNINNKFSNNIINIDKDTYYNLNETIMDKSLNKKSDYLLNSINCFTYTKGNNHISPVNNFKAKKMFSSFTNKNMNNTNNNLNSNYNCNKRSSVVLQNKKKI